MPTKWPKTSDELKASGYEYDNDGTCRGCQAPIEWWISPNDKRTPMSVIRLSDKADTIKEKMLKKGHDVRQPHFIDCPEAARFRR